jgi:hypothetical protein
MSQPTHRRSEYGHFSSEELDDERSAGNLHATFCGSRGAGDRSRPPRCDQRWSSLPRQLCQLTIAGLAPLSDGPRPVALRPGPAWFVTNVTDRSPLQGLSLFRTRGGEAFFYPRL